MSTFPVLKSGAVLQYPAARSMRYSTGTLRFLDGSEQRYSYQRGSLRRWFVRLDLLDEDETARVTAFFESQQGRLGAFRFTDPWTGIAYDNCSLASDEFESEHEGEDRVKTYLIVGQNAE